MIAGIYRINGPNNKIYFGSSYDINGRWSDHINELRNNRHNNDHLQKSYNKYGESAFTFSIVDIVEDVSTLLDVEQDYLDWLFRYIEPEYIYNIARSATAPMVGRTHSIETRNKLSLVQKGRSHAVEHTQKVADANRGRKNHDTVKDAMALAKSGGKIHNFISPDNKTVEVINLAKFRRENGLYASLLHKLMNCKVKQYKGWRYMGVVT